MSSDDPAAPDPVDAEFVSVPEAARLLGVSERTAYRRALNLTEGSDRVTEGGRVRVRRSALGIPSSNPRISDKVTEQLDRMTEHVREYDGKPSVPRDVLIERVEQLQARLTDAEKERDDWKGQARSAQEAERLALAALREEQSRSAVLLAAREMKQVGPAAQDSPTASPVPESGAGEGRRGEGVGDRSAALRADLTKPAGFWARLLGKGSAKTRL